MRLSAYLLLLLTSYSAQGKEISDGTDIVIEDKGFTITPPSDWEIHRSQDRGGLLIQVPYKEDIPYQRNIRVLTFQEPTYIDEYMAEEFEHTLVERYSNSSSSISNYIVRNNQMINMADGRQAVLYYTEFQFNSTPLMQAHLLISGQDKHYLISYTDLASEFEKAEGENQSLQTAWSSITSVRVKGEGPVRFQSPRSLLIIAAIILVFGGIAIFVRRRSTAEKYREWSDQDHEDIDLEEDSHNQLVEVETYDNQPEDSAEEDHDNNWSFSSSEATQIKDSPQQDPSDQADDWNSPNEGEDVKVDKWNLPT